MKKTMFALIALMMFSFSGCSASDDEIVEIPERLFIRQMTHIVLNHREYEGRSIKLEGLFRELQRPTRSYYVVMRYVVCCDYKLLYFEINLNGFEPLENDTWVEVIGTLDMQTGLPVLHVTSLIELEERGEAFLGS